MENAEYTVIASKSFGRNEGPDGKYVTYSQGDTVVLSAGEIQRHFQNGQLADANGNCPREAAIQANWEAKQERLAAERKSAVKKPAGKSSKRSSK